MACSSLTLHCLLVALSAATLLPAEARVPPNGSALQDRKLDGLLLNSTWWGDTTEIATPQPDGANSIPNSTWEDSTTVSATPSLVEEADFTLHTGGGGTAPSVRPTHLDEADSTPNSTSDAPVDVTSAAAAHPMDGISGAPTPMKLTCPSENPDRFSAIGWYIIRGTEMCGLYQVDTHGLIYEYENEKPLNMRFNVTDPYTLTIYDNVCNHTETYQCVRHGQVGFRNEFYNFHVDNCTVTLEPAVTLGNAAPYLIPATAVSLMFAVGAVVYFTRCY